MNRYLISLLIGCLLISAGYEWVAPDWNGYYLSKLIFIAALAGILWHKLPYTELLFKSVAFIVFLDAIWNVQQFLIDGIYQGPLELLNALIFVPWLAWAMLRAYEPIGDNLEPGKVYYIAHRPDDIAGFFLSLFGSPVGGVSLLIDHKVYGYHRSKFEIRNLPDRLNIVAMDSGIPNSEELMDCLHSMDEKRWSLINNCVSLRWKVSHVRQTTL